MLNRPPPGTVVVVPDWDAMHDKLAQAPFDPAPTAGEWIGLMNVVEAALAAYGDWAAGHREDESFLALGLALGMQQETPAASQQQGGSDVGR